MTVKTVYKHNPRSGRFPHTFRIAHTGDIRVYDYQTVFWERHEILKDWCRSNIRKGTAGQRSWQIRFDIIYIRHDDDALAFRMMFT